MTTIKSAKKIYEYPRTAIAITNEMHQRLANYCKKHGCKMNAITEMALDQYLSWLERAK